MSRAWQLELRDCDAVLFDFDGTLAPNLDLPDLRRRVIDFTLRHDVPEPVFTGRYIVEILDAARAWLSAHDPAAGDDFHRRGHRLIREFEVAAARATRPFDDAVQVLARLRRAGKRVAVITRNCREAVLAAFPELPDACDRLLARDDVAHLKPDPRHLEEALQALAVAGSRSMMVGDGQLDMRLGKDCGLYCVGVLTGSSDRRRLLEAGADVVLPRTGSLLEAIDGHAGQGVSSSGC